MTRLVPFLMCFLVVSLPLLAQEAGKLDIRYRVESNVDRFPQKKPQEALKTIVKVIGEKKFDYLLAQLTLPSQIDPRVLRIADTFSKGSLEDRKFIAFDEVVRVTAEHFLKDPVLFNELQRFATGGEWEEKDDRAVATHKELPGRKVIFHKLENRWFLDNRQK